MCRQLTAMRVIAYRSLPPYMKSSKELINTKSLKYQMNVKYHRDSRFKENPKNIDECGGIVRNSPDIVIFPVYHYRNIDDQYYTSCPVVEKIRKTH